MTTLISLCIGAASGALAAVFGVGGGIVMVPSFVTLLGLSQKAASATSLAAIIVIAMAGTFKNQTNGLIDWRVTVPSAIGGCLVAWLAADMLKYMSNELLSRGFACLLIFMGIRMLLTK